MNSFEERRKSLNADMRRLRLRMIEKMKKEPSLELSEELRKLDYDIEFWESADDSTPVGLLKHLNESLASDRYSK